MFVAYVTRVVLQIFSALRHAGVPLIVGLLVSLISGVVCLLLHMITLAVILGYTFASMLIVVSTEKGKMGEDEWVQR